MAKNDKQGLTPCQQLFALYYVAENFNITHAAIKAGASPKTAHASGHRWFKNVKVKALIDQIVGKKKETLGVNVDAIIKKLAVCATADAKHFCKRDGAGKVVLKDVLEMGDESLAIKKITQRTHIMRVSDDETIETVELGYEFHDSIKAAALLGSAKDIAIWAKTVDPTPAQGSGNVVRGPYLFLPDNGR